MIKLEYISSIIGEISRLNNPSKVAIKRQITEMMVVDKEKWESSTIKSERPILGFLDSEKVRGILNDVFPLVISVFVANYDFFQVMIDENSSYHIMYVELFLKFELKKEKLWPREGSDL